MSAPTIAESAMRVDISHATFEYPPRTQPADSVIWHGATQIADELNSGSDDGQLLIRLTVDGMFDIIVADLRMTGKVEGIDRAIYALQHAREALVALGQDRPGRCMSEGDTGRCSRRSGHEDPHNYPTEVVCA